MEAKRDLSVSYNKLGDIAKAEGNLSEAKRYYKLCLDIFEALVKETGTVKSKRDLSVSYNLLGDIAKAEGNLTEAKRYYTLCLEIAEALAKETGTVEAYDDLALSYYNIAFCQTGFFSKRRKKREHLKKALSIWERLSQACPNVYEYARRRDIVKEALGIK